MTEIPDAQTEDDQSDDSAAAGMFSNMPPLIIGDPFAMADGVELLEAPPRQGNAPQIHPGCVAIVRCEGEEGRPCGQIFRIDLLLAGVKTCPKCAQRYSHVLLVAPDKDDDIIPAAMAQVLRSNGYPVPDEGDDDDDE